jgi:hypothetical protein
VRLLLATFAILAAGLAACATPKPVNLESDFDARQARRLMAPGPNAVAGRALLPQRGGSAVTCAGRVVLLIPATAYAEEWARHEFEWLGPAERAVGFRNVASATTVYVHPAEFVERQRSTQCDAQGRFRFDGVADGRFIVMTEITWTAGTAPQGGRIARSVTLAGGQPQELLLTLE